VQALVEEALSQLDKRPVVAVAAGRTDSGVHAIGQVVSAQIQGAIPDSALRPALNAILPDDIRVLAAESAPASFNARFDARSKLYSYRIFNGEMLMPFARRYCWHVSRPLDLAAMRQAAELLIGRHDFSAFQAAGGDVISTVRTVDTSEWLEERAELETPTLTYRISGNGFLRHMVRNIVGTLVEVGAGRRDATWVRTVLASKSRQSAGPTAPAHGLYLVRVDYDTAGLEARRDPVEDEDGRDILQ
jgi:tRNA pseudouridine38-40 synthase